jgi:hypothetical protein
MIHLHILHQFYSASTSDTVVVQYSTSTTTSTTGSVRYHQLS